MKYIFICPDGMTDEPLSELKGKTPLEVARTTNMDHLAANGMSGLVQTIPEGMDAGSDVGNLSLLGYDPKKYLTGRAPLEAASMNIDLRDNEVAFRCNLVSVFNGIMHDYSAGHIKTDEAKELINALSEVNPHKECRFYPGKSYRHLMIMKTINPAALCKIKTVPPHDIMGEEMKRYLPQGPKTEILLSLMEHARRVFSDHPVNRVRQDLNENPANAIWLWGQGTRLKMPAFKDLYGISGGIISAVDLVRGIGKLAGLDLIEVEGITGYYDTNFLGKAQRALEFLNTSDFVYIHVEATDEAGHNGDIENKIKAIENIDRDIIGTILNHFDQHDDVRILVCADHPTPIRLRTHTSNPVNFVMFGKGIEPDGGGLFSEKTSAQNGLIFKSGPQMMEFFIQKYL